MEDTIEVVQTDIRKNSVRFKFIGGSGITIRRDNPDYLRCIGTWFCNEVDAMPTQPAKLKRWKPTDIRQGPRQDSL